jgi:hypothetical protein
MNSLQSSEERLLHFVAEVHASAQVWLLQADSGMFAMLEDENGQSYLPVWESSTAAGTAAVADWEGYQPAAMDMKEFNQWLHELDEDGILLGVSPDEHGKILPFKGEVLRNLLNPL